MHRSVPTTRRVHASLSSSDEERAGVRSSTDVLQSELPPRARSLRTTTPPAQPPCPAWRHASSLWHTAALGLFAFLLTAVAAEPRVTCTLTTDSLACHDFAELILNIAEPRPANPFTDATVEGTFGRKGEPPLHVDGFCDAADGSVFRIRFMPTQPGEYEYTVKYREGAFETSYQGTFRAESSARKGLVRVDPEFPWHFQWEGTKEPYFWNGTTAYWLAGWDEKTIDQIIKRLDRFKVTRVRAALNSRVKDGRAWFENVFPTEKFSFLLNPWVAKNPTSVEKPEFDVSRFNVAHWRKFEHLLHQARSKDMIVSVIFYVDGRRPGVDPFGKECMGGPDEQRYYRYALARLARPAGRHSREPARSWSPPQPRPEADRKDRG
jgi:hypothetical protein